MYGSRRQELNRQRRFFARPSVLVEFPSVVLCSLFRGTNAVRGSSATPSSSFCRRNLSKRAARVKHNPQPHTATTEQKQTVLERRRVAQCCVCRRRASKQAKTKFLCSVAVCTCPTIQRAAGKRSRVHRRSAEDSLPTRTRLSDDER